MTDRHTVDTITSDDLDQLYDQLDRARALADRWDNALAVDKPYARTLRAALDGPGPADTGAHIYLSTGCHHGDEPFAHGLTGHQYCQNKNGVLGPKKPAQCKGETCHAPCICPCHTDQAKEQ